jgi:hypothetical protein
MATPWEQVLQQVPTLNDPQSPVSYSVTPEGVIVGFWDVAKIEMLGIAGASTFSKDYRVDVRPTGDGEIESVEVGNESSGSIGPTGGSFEKSTFKGRRSEKSFGFQLGAGGTSHGEPTNAAGWSFDTDQIKKPLFGFLEQHGWQEKGFLGKLFS